MKRHYPVVAAFLIPAMALLVIFKIYPILLGVYDSLFSYSFVNKTTLFAGLGNYITVLKDASFQNSLKVTLFFNVIVNPIQVVLSFGLALLLMVKLKGQRVFRTVHIIPITVSFTIACTLWGVFLSPEQGLMNSILNLFGISNQAFLNNSKQALAWVMVIATWKGLGYWALFFITGLEEIPSQLYEAASIDGAGYWKTLRYVTLPQMKRTFKFVIISDTISNFILFVPAYVLTGGGPEGSTDFLMYRIYRTAYKYSNINQASAMIVILLLLLVVIIGIESYLLRERE